MSNNILTKKFSIGLPSYINAIPIKQQLLLDSSINIVCDYPTNLSLLLKNRSIDVALTSSYEVIKNKYRYINSKGIGAFKKISSVNLYIKDSFFYSNKPVICISNETSSSFQLLQLLCQYKWKNDPQFIIMNDMIYDENKYDGVLYIGDHALIKQHLLNHTTYDLAYEWFLLTKMPFVFALYAFNDYVNDDNYQLLCSKINNAIKNINISTSIKEAQKQFQLEDKALHNYFNLCIYDFDYICDEGLSTFKKMLHL